MMRAGGERVINIDMKHFEYRIRRIFITSEGKTDCDVQRKSPDGWEDVDNKRLRRTLAELGLKRMGGYKYEADKERLQHLSERNRSTYGKRRVS